MDKMKAYEVYIKNYRENYYPYITYAETDDEAKRNFMRDKYYNLEDYSRLQTKRKPENDKILYDDKYLTKNEILNMERTREYQTDLYEFLERHRGKTCYIRSDELNNWWRDGGNGYTDSLYVAGVFSIEDAVNKCLVCGIEKGLRLVLCEEINEY